MHEKLQALLTYWQSRRHGDDLPLRGDFTPFTLKPWLGSLSLLQEIQGGRDFLVILDGSRIVDQTGEDWTGLSTSAIDAKIGIGLTGQLQDCCRAKTHMHSIYDWVWPKEWLRFDRLLLPVWDPEKDAHLVILGLYPIAVSPVRAAADRIA